MTVPTRDRLLDAGLGMMLERGYNHLGIQNVLASTGVPKGSFYHHFESKEDFGLQVIDRYMTVVHAGLDAALRDERVPPLQRVRNFFEATRDKYRDQGYLGCLLGGLGQELSGVSDVFRNRIERCLTEIANQIAVCLDQAIARGDLSRDVDAKQLAHLLVDCWEGAALRSRLGRDPAPLRVMLDFYFGAIATGPTRKRGASSARAARPARRTDSARRRRGSTRTPARRT